MADELSNALRGLRQKAEEMKQKESRKKLRDDEDPESVSLNELISQFAQRKQLREAKDKYHEALRRDIANHHTYSCTMNAHVRCGDIQGAATVFKDSRKAGFPLDVVSCTTMIKGYCSEGDLSSALNLIDEMESANPPVLPNIRTVNTYLRGCVTTGAVDPAIKMLDRLLGLKITPDSSTFDYVLTLLGQGLQLRRSLDIISKSANRNCISVQQHLSVARAAALLGSWETCVGSLNKADTMLIKEADAAGGDSKTLAGGSNTGGKRSKNEMAEERAKSLEAFVEHRAEELKREAAMLRNYCAKYSAEGKMATRLLRYYQKLFAFDVASPTTNQTNPLHCTACQKTFAKDTVYQAHLSGKKHIGAVAGMKNAEAKKIPEALASALVSGYGIEECLWQVCQEEGAGEKDVLRRAREVPQKLSDVTARFKEQVNVEGHMMLPTIFDKPERPIKLEICSGSGEWAVEQAKSDPESNWVTLEYRADRVYQTFTRMVMQRCDNLSVMAGDANRVLPERLQATSVKHVFINHPQPPQQRGNDPSVAHTQGAHLLTQEFFKNIHRILCSEGRLTLVTDNLWYGQLLLQIVAHLHREEKGDEKTKYFGSVPLDISASSGRRVQEQCSGFKLYVGAPGLECGHIVSASSYFDRLWAKEKVTERYFLCLNKVDHDDDGKVTGKTDLLNASVASLEKGYSKKRKREEDLEDKRKKMDSSKLKKKKHSSNKKKLVTEASVIDQKGTKSLKKRRTPKKKKAGKIDAKSVSVEPTE